MNVKKRVYRILSLILVIALVLVVLAGCGKTEVSNPYRSIKGASIESTQLSENTNFELYWDNEAGAILYKSLNNNSYWSDILYEAYLEGSESVNANSPISITVANTKTLKWDTVTSYSQMQNDGNTVCKRIDNGIRVTYFFEKYRIAIPVDYTLNNDFLNISIDSSVILEDGEDYKLVSISVAPYLCSVSNGANDGNLLIPAGSGALMNASETAEGTQTFSGEVYGEDAARQTTSDFLDNESIRLPVFGAYGDSQGLFAIIEKGAGASVIEAQSGNENLGYSNIYPVFYVRGYDEFYYNFHGDEALTKRVSEKISGVRFSANYYPLFGEKANYNGMAEIYRDYLIAKGELKNTEINSQPYSVTFMGGTEITKSILGIPVKKTAALTTFVQAEEILNDLNTSVGVLPTVRLMGYGDKGVNAGEIAGGKNIPSIYGGKEKLLNLIKSLSGAQLFLDNEIIKFSESGNGFSINSDVAKTAVKYKSEHFAISPIRVLDEKNPYYILSRNNLFKSFEKGLNKVSKFNGIGVSYSSLGSIAYSDYSDYTYATKNLIEQDVSSVFTSTKNKGYLTATADANWYAACAADVLFDISTDSGNSSVFDEEIPFYQLVFHSYKPMYTNAINLAEDVKTIVAKAAAYGMGLGYTIIDTYVDGSDDLDKYGFYGMVYEDNKELLKNTLLVNEYINMYDLVSESVFERYFIAEDGLSVSEYSNGTRVYVNMTDSVIGDLEPYEFYVENE